MTVSPLYLSLALLALAAPAAAQTDVPRSRHLGAIEACRAITDGTARLACFDRETAALLSATTAGQLSIVDREDMRTARRSLFGFSLPKLPFFSGDKSADEAPDQIETTIRSAYGIENGRYRMTLADSDAVWETTDNPMRLEEPRSGQKIVIKKGAMGSYFLRIDGQIGVKGRRVK